MEEKIIVIPYQGEKLLGQIRKVAGIFQNFKIEDNNLFLNYLFNSKEISKKITFKISEDLAKKIIAFDFTEPDSHICLWEETEEEVRSFRSDIGYSTEKLRLPVRINCVCSAFEFDLGLVPLCVIEVLKNAEFQKKLPSDFVPTKEEVEKEVVQEQETKTETKPALPEQKDKREEEIKNLESKLSIAESKLEESQTELKRLQEKDEESITTQNLDDFFTDSELDSNLEQKLLKTFEDSEEFNAQLEKKEKGSLEVNQKKAKNLLWELLKECQDKRVSEENLTHLLVRLKWEIIDYLCQIDILEDMLKKSSEQDNKLTNDVLVLQKEKQIAQDGLKTSRQEIARLNDMKDYEELQELVQQPQKFGYKLPPSRYQILLFLKNHGGKADWGTIDSNLRGVGKSFKSLSTLGLGLNCLKDKDFIEKKGKDYVLTSKGLNLVDAYEGR
jgi:hypothetical protein